MSYIMDVANVITPNVVGSLLPQALRQLSELQLYGHIISEKEDADIEPGTVLEQMPHGGYRMKPRQSVGLIIIKKPKELLAFHAVGRPIHELLMQAEADGIRIKTHEIGLEGVDTICCAQYPRPQQDLADHTIHVYSPQNRNMLCIMPDFRGVLAAELAQILALHGLTMKAFHDTTAYLADHACRNCIVKDQKPAPGELINKDTTRIIHVHVGEKT